MVQARFPKKRDDGSVHVAARFRIETSTAVGLARDLLRAWLAEQQAAGATWAEDLVSEPLIAVRDQDVMDVVFEGRSGVARWKDWMVSVSQQLAKLPGLRFDCFYDLVAQVRHPASDGRSNNGR